MPAVAHPSARRTAVLLRLAIALPALGGCASLLPPGRGRAAADALRAVCGPPSAARDSSCVIRGAERARGGYLVTVDRRPPSGQDRVRVHVRRGGRIVVTPLDTARAPTGPGTPTP
jgi:hypothetical protein